MMRSGTVTEHEVAGVEEALFAERKSLGEERYGYSRG